MMYLMAVETIAGDFALRVMLLPFKADSSNSCRRAAGFSNLLRSGSERLRRRTRLRFTDENE